LTTKDGCKKKANRRGTHFKKRTKAGKGQRGKGPKKNGGREGTCSTKEKSQGSFRGGGGQRTEEKSTLRPGGEDAARQKKSTDKGVWGRKGKKNRGKKREKQKGGWAAHGVHGWKKAPLGETRGKTISCVVKKHKKGERKNKRREKRRKKDTPITGGNKRGAI